MSTRGEQLFDAIEADVGMSNELSRAAAFEEAMKAFEADGNKQRAEECKFEVIVHNFYRSDSDGVGEHFRPIFENEDGSTWPALDKVPEGFREYISRRADDSSNPILKSWYCDFLWDKYKDHTHGRQATEAYLKCIELFRGKLEDQDTADAIRRCAVLVRIFKQQPLYRTVEDEILETISTLEKAGERHWLSRISESLILIPTVSEVSIEAAKLAVRRTVDWFKENEEFHAQRFTLEGLVKLEEFHGNESALNPLQVELGMSYVLEGDSRSKESSLVAAHWYQTAMQHFASIGWTQPIEALRIRLEEAGVRAADEIHPIEVSLPIPADEVASFVDEFTNGSLRTALLSVGKHFVPSVEQTKSLIESLKRQSPLHFRIGHTLSNVRGMIVARPETESERAKFYLYQQLSMRVLMSATIFQSKVFQALRGKLGLTAESMMSHISQADLFVSRSNSLLEYGVKRYFEEDFVGAIHVLVPQVEDVIRGCLVHLGRPSTGPNPNVSGGMLAKTLGTVLNDPVIIESLGEDITAYLKVVLTDPFGLNVRNEIAHGLLPMEGFSQTKCEIILQIILMLASLKVVRNSQS